MFLDADDRLCVDRISELMNFVRGRHWDLVYFDANECDDELKITRRLKSIPVDSDVISKSVAVEKCFQPSMVWIRLYRREIVHDY